MSGAVEIIGVDNVVALLEKYNVTKIKVLVGKATKYEGSIDEDTTRDELIEDFINDFCSTIPATNYKKYTLEITYKNRALKNSSISVDFAFNTNTSNTSHWDKKETTKVSSNELSQKELMDISREIGKLEAENIRLQNQILEYDEVDEEEQNIGNVPIGEKLLGVLLPHADSIIGAIIGSLTNKNQVAMAGVPSDINQLLNEMISIEPDFPEHLSLLLNLRKNKSAIYSMALNQLKNL